MKNLNCISFFTICLFAITFPSCSAELVTESIGFISSILGIISYFLPGFENPMIDQNHFDVMHAINQIQISERLKTIEQELETMSEYIGYSTNYISEVTKLNADINKIDEQYRAMLDRAEKLHNGTQFNEIDKNEISKIAIDYLSSKSALLRIVMEIYSTFVDKGSPTSTYISSVMKNQGPDSPCSEAGNLQSNQQILQKLIAAIVISQAKVYSTATMAANYINETKGSYPTQIYEEVIEPVTKMYRKTVKFFKKLMPETSRDVRVCDPRLHVKDVTFIQLLNVFQKQIVDRHHFDPPMPDVEYVLIPLDRPGKNIQSKHWWWSNSNVPNLTYHYYDIYTQHHERVSDLGPIFKRNPICQGPVWDCKSLSGSLGESSASNDFLICHSLPNSGRRFERIEVQNRDWVYKSDQPDQDPPIRRIYGPKKPCDFTRQNYSVIPDASVCTCDETESRRPIMVRSNYSYRFFFTADVQVTSKEYVVTGVKLGQYNGVIFPIIEEGRLLPEGIIDQNSRRWVNPADNKHRLTDRANLEKIDWPDRTIKLGDIDLPRDRVLTGLFFTRTNPNTLVVGPLRLALIWRAFDFKTGQIFDRTSKWQQIKDDYGESDTDRFNYRQSEMVEHVENAQLPELSQRNKYIETNKYLNFSTSDFQTDFGQTTIPYIDTQPVLPKIAVPLSGAGLYYKYRPGYAGFIGITLKTYDISPYIEEPTDKLPESIIKEILKNKVSLRLGNLGLFYF